MARGSQCPHAAAWGQSGSYRATGSPCPGWRAAYAEAVSLARHVGAASGPHLPRPDTSPMIARELEEFVGAFSPSGEPVVQRVGDAPFLSNVNACVARSCW